MYMQLMKIILESILSAVVNTLNIIRIETFMKLYINIDVSLF